MKTANGIINPSDNPKSDSYNRKYKGRCMSSIKLFSWNVNGIRAAHKKGLLEWIKEVEPSMLCIQETKAHPDQLVKNLIDFPGYSSYFSSAERKGYSGTALYSVIEPNSVEHGFGIEKFDIEGRILCAHYDDFTLINIYYPNGKQSPERLQYKMDFYDAFLDWADRMKDTGKKLIICGDVNTAHKEIDLARPKPNEKTSGFLPEERAWIDKFISHGYLDTFRIFNRDGGNYTWWDMITRARERNVGWRIDYFFVCESMRERVIAADIHADIMGSDHCPISLTIEI